MRACPLFLSGVLTCAAAELTLLPEHARPAPHGGIAAANVGGQAAGSRLLTLEMARGGYVSCHLVMSIPEGGPYSLSVSGPLPSELYREWFHLLPVSGQYYPDALVPVASPYRSQMPEPDNAIPNQTAQAFWMDVWVPADARPGVYKITATLDAAKKRTRATLEVRVLSASVPATDAVTMDHNSYGTSWLAEQYPKLRTAHPPGKEYAAALNASCRARFSRARSESRCTRIVVCRGERSYSAKGAACSGDVTPGGSSIILIFRKKIFAPSDSRQM